MSLGSSNRDQFTEPWRPFSQRYWADEKLRCFVLMPFASDFNSFFEIIRSSLAAPRWECHRADEQWSSRMVHPSIIHGIREADFIVAEVTGNNPNVYYEIGVAQALGKEVLLLTQDISGTRFDLKAFNLHSYTLASNGANDLIAKLNAAAQRIEHLVSPFHIEDRYQRTLRIIRELDELLRRQREGERVMIATQAGFSSVCNLNLEDDPLPENRDYGRKLEEEGALMRELVRGGAQLKAIIRPPAILVRDTDRSRLRLDALLDFLKCDDSFMRNCEYVLTTEGGTNLLALNQEIVFEGYKTAIEGGFGWTCVSRHRDWVKKRMEIFDGLFASAREYTLQAFRSTNIKKGRKWSPLRCAVITALEELRLKWKAAAPSVSKPKCRG